MESDLSLDEIQKEWHGSLKAYVIGFISSLIFTGASFMLVIAKPFTGNSLVNTLMALAVLQAIFQVRFFLHVGEEPKPRWETLVFYFMLVILFIVALGTLWIMFDLNERVMAGMAMDMDMSHD